MYKLVIQYILLVGLPVLGVLGFLEIGKKLQAPVSVAGIWALEFADGSQSSGGCLGFSGWMDDPQLAISQSGRHLELEINDTDHTSLIGKVQEMSFIARQNPDLDQEPGLQLVAKLDRQVQPNRLAIEITRSQCAGSLTLSAVRSRASISGSGGH